MQDSRIRLARLAQGLSLQQAADALGRHGLKISRAALHKHEAGTSAPTARVLTSLAALYRVPAHELLHPATDHVRWLAFRKRASLTSREAARAMAIAERRAEQHVRFERLFPPAPRAVSARPQVKDHADAESCAERLRQRWGLGDGPIPSVSQAIEDQGGVVVEIPAADNGFDGLSGFVNDRTPLLVVSADAPSDRRRYTLSHELGHTVMQCDALPQAQQEAFAHRFAAAFVVPGKTAIRELGAKRRHLELEEMVLLKARYGFSVQAWMRRARDLEIITQALYVQLCKRINALGWRRQEPGDFASEGHPTRLRRHILRAHAESLITQVEAEQLIREHCPPLEAQPVRTVDARTLIYQSPGAQREAMQQAAESVAADYSATGGLREFDAFGESDLPDDDVAE